jgi:hypothetical protein
MATAAERVLAIPELLENILLYVDGTSEVEVAKRLFLLLRVDKTFEATLRNSPRLKYRMGIDYNPEGYRGIFTISRMLSMFLGTSSPYLPVRSCVGGSGVLNIGYDLNITTTSREQILAFFSNNGRERIFGQYPWHQATISRVNIAVQVEVRVQSRILQPGERIVQSVVEYSVHRRFEGGRGTLRDLAEFLNKANRRARLRHFARTATESLASFIFLASAAARPLIEAWSVLPESVHLASYYALFGPQAPVHDIERVLQLVRAGAWKVTCFIKFLSLLNWMSSWARMSIVLIFAMYLVRMW